MLSLSPTRGRGQGEGVASSSCTLAASDDGQSQAVHGARPRQAGSLSPSGGAGTSKALTTPHSIAK